ncbi:MAG: holB [Clostridia bacterium]|jgi:DNA polymerase-3 subunit delta'|nr:holB [Clostridia bacterium]
MFENILGHGNEKNILKDSISQGKVSHSYLFTGPSGIGKLLVAKEFAKAILNVSNLNSCPDYKYICKKEDKKNILVEQIRDNIVNDIYVSPATGDMKVYIIDGAEYLNDASQNALLKTLEEPPKHAVIILIASSSSNLLPTVISRVYKINFNKLSTEIVDKYISENFDTNLDKNIIEFADGSIGFMLEIINEKLTDELNKINELYKSIVTKDVIKCLKESEGIDFTKKHTLDYLQHVLFSSNKYLCTEIIEKAKERLKYNGNYDIVIDNMILKCIENI